MAACADLGPILCMQHPFQTSPVCWLHGWIGHTDHPNALEPMSRAGPAWASHAVAYPKLDLCATRVLDWASMCCAGLDLVCVLHAGQWVNLGHTLHVVTAPDQPCVLAPGPGQIGPTVWPYTPEPVCKAHHGHLMQHKPHVDFTF